MVMDELKRVSADRDSLKTKLSEAEKKTKDAYDEAAGLRKERDELVKEKQATPEANGDPLGVEKSQVSKDGPKSAAKGAQAEDKDGEDFFSYESEVPRLRSELKEQADRVEELTTENKTLRGDLETARSSDQEMVSKVEETTTSRADASQESEASTEAIERLQKSLQEHERSLEDIKAAVSAADLRSRTKAMLRTMCHYQIAFVSWASVLTDQHLLKHNLTRIR